MALQLIQFLNQRLHNAMLLDAGWVFCSVSQFTFSHLKISELFPWYTTLQFAQKTSPRLTKEYLRCMHQHRASLEPPLHLRAGGGGLVREFLPSCDERRSGLWGKVCLWHPACLRSSLLPGRDRLAPLLHSALRAPSLPLCVAACLEQARPKILKRKMCCWRPR